MAGDVIDSLLVRLGLEADDKDFQEANSLFDGVKSRALQFGAVIGGGLGLNALTFGFARAKDEMGKFADVYGVSAQFIDSLGYAINQSGGEAEDAFSSIEKIRNLLKDAEWGRLPEESLLYGADPYAALEGVTSVAEAYERLAGATSDLSPENARRTLEALGFGQAEITLFRGRGAGSFASLMAEGEAYAKVTREMTEQATQFQTSLVNLTKSVDGLGNEISVLVLGDFAETMQSMADYLRDNRDPIAGFFEEAMPWLEATAIGVGALVAIQGGQALVSKLGLVGKVGPALGIGLAYQFAKENPDYVDNAKAAFQSSWNYRFGDDPDDYTPAGLTASDIPGSADIPGSSNQYNISVDARGSADPQATEEAARRGAEAAINRAAQNAMDDLRTPVK